MGDLGGPFDVAIIGSGMSGLVAANVLAREGRRVLLCEQHYRYGGYLQQFMLHRTPFDAGCHYVGALGPGQVFDRYLRYLGVRDELRAVALDPEGFDVLDLGADGQLAVPVGHERWAARLAERFPHEAVPARAFIGAIREEVRRFPMYTLRAAATPTGPAPDSGRTVSAVLAEAGVRDPALRRALLAPGLLYFVAPEECPFALHAFVADSYLQGAYGLEGGGHAMVKALLRAFRGRGGVTRRRCRITAIDVRDGRVRGLRTADGEREEADTVIACMDPQATLRLLPEHATRPAWRHRVERMRPGIGGFACYVRVDADLSAYGRRNTLVLTDGASGLFSQGWLSGGGVPPTFVTVPSARERRWRGPAAVIGFTGVDAARWDHWAGTRTGERGPEYEALKRQIGQRVLEAVHRAVPEARTHAVTADFATPLTHRDYTGNTGGAIYGLHHSIDQVGMRGVSWRTRIGGLLLSGHSVLYPGLLGATIAAFYTCGELIGLPTLHERLVRA